MSFVLTIADPAASRSAGSTEERSGSKSVSIDLMSLRSLPVANAPHASSFAQVNREERHKNTSLFCCDPSRAVRKGILKPDCGLTMAVERRSWTDRATASILSI
jgi:hypothetical protein